MRVLIALLRAVNLAGHNSIKMLELRRLCTSLGLEDAVTYLQSGNVVFRTALAPAKAVRALEDGIEKEFGFHSDVILRTPDELREVVAANPFDMKDREPSKLLVLFLGSDPGSDVRSRLEAMPTAGEEVKARGREVFVYYPNGMGRSKLALDKVLRMTATGRNWRTVTKLLEIAEGLASGPLPSGEHS